MSCDDELLRECFVGHGTIIAGMSLGRLAEAAYPEAEHALASALPHHEAPCAMAGHARALSVVRARSSCSNSSRRTS